MHIIRLDIVVGGRQRGLVERSADKTALDDGGRLGMIMPWLPRMRGEWVHVRLRPLFETDLENALELAVALGWLGCVVRMLPPLCLS